MEKEILTEKHPRWPEYIFKLTHLLTAHGDGVETGNCYDDFRHTERILSTMPEIDVEATIAYFKKHYGDCDCKVFMLVA